MYFVNIELKIMKMFKHISWQQLSFQVMEVDKLFPKLRTASEIKSTFHFGAVFMS